MFMWSLVTGQGAKRTSDDGSWVEGDLTKVIFITDILSTDIFDHRLLLYWNSQLRILDRRNFIHENFEGGILYTEISTLEFSP